MLPGTLDYFFIPFPEESGLNLTAFNPTAITVAPNGDIFLSDGYASNHIFKFGKSGKHLMHFGTKRNALKWFNTAHGFYWDKDKNLYVQDWNVSGRIMKLVRLKE